MTYRDRDLLEDVPEKAPAKASSDERSSLLQSLKRVVRDAIMRQVSTKR
jgi:hypothetical protein